MDKNQIIGVSLLVVIVVVFSILNKPSEEQLAKEQHLRDSIEAVQKAEVNTARPQNTETLASADAIEPDSASAANTQKEEFFQMENEKMLVRVSNVGGKIAYIKLKEYQRADSTELILTEPGKNNFSFTYNNNLSTDGLWFEVQSSTNSSLVLTANIVGGKIEHVYKISPDNYILDFESNWVGAEPEKLVWTQEILQQEHRAENERQKTTVYFKEAGNEPDYVSERKDEDEENLGGENSVDWISFKQHFFSQTIIPQGGFKSGYLRQDFVEGDEFIRKLHASMDLNKTGQHKFQMIFTPNQYATLRSYDKDLEHLVNLGWGIFGWVNRFLVIPVFKILSNFTNSYGLIIFILTLVFKVLLLFFTYKSFLSGAKMRVLKPELDAIKKKHDGDMQAQQAEQMKLYQATGVSPFGGCLPLIVQMPILLALFNFFPNSFELRQKSFLWATDLSSYDSIYDFGFSIPGYGDHISLFALLMTISTFIYTIINQQYQPQQQQKELKYLPYIMPIVFLSFLNNYSAALSYYYFLANIMSIGQTYLFKAFVDDKALRAQIEEKRKNKAAGGAASGGGGMQGRMQEWLEKQQRKQSALQQQKSQPKKK